MSQYQREAMVAREAARAAMTILRDHQGPRQVTRKGDVDLVTEVDLACEEAIRDVLQRYTPDIPVLGEEQGGPENAPTRWVVDPLDGTTNFVHGYPFFCTSIALEVREEPVAACVGDPIRGHEYWAAKGHGAFRDDRPIRVGVRTSLENALIATGFSYDRKERAAFYLDRVRAVMERCRGLRRGGAAALELALLADGRSDAFWEYNLKRWDVAAGSLLLTEAGGVITDIGGGPMTGVDVHPVAGNPTLHALLQQVLSEVP